MYATLFLSARTSSITWPIFLDFISGSLIEYIASSTSLTNSSISKLELKNLPMDLSTASRTLVLLNSSLVPSLLITAILGLSTLS